ncbi:MAG: nucleotide sugar dehydrogenase [Alphaproteobacteria bacterium]
MSATGLEKLNFAVIGVGYVGLPVAVGLARDFATLAFDLNPERIEELRAGHDRTLEVSPEELAGAKHLRFSAQAPDLAEANFYIVTVPTPIDAHRVPDLSALISASEIVGNYLKVGDVVVFESTVYPGATEEICVPALEKASKLVFNKDFTVGYSPERMNPGDKEHRLADIIKVTAGSTPETADLVDRVYRHLVTAGTHKAPSIRVAEAAKVIENVQRDVNIALINELAILFRKLDLDTEDVLAAARTKWNFLPFSPGFVGGHCIGVDPYYLTHKAQEVGHHPEIILAGRRINNSMPDYAAGLVLDAMMASSAGVAGAKALVMGLTFKENTPDLRNTKVVEMVRALEKRGVVVDIFDPWADKTQAHRELGVELCEKPRTKAYDVVILTVRHRQFVEMGEAAVRALLAPGGFIADLKWVLPRTAADIRL